MAVFTSTPRGKVSWEAPAQVAANQSVFLLIDDDNFLLIDANDKLVITRGQGQDWTTTSKDYVATF